MASISNQDPVILSGHGASSNEGVQISLHPLPLLSISEHYTRVRIQSGGDGDNVKVIGALIGVQQGREIEIMNSFELALSDDGSEVNHAFFTDRQAQFKQVFPAFEFLGWYTVVKAPTPLDLSLHTQLLPYNESPIFLTLSPSAINQATTSSASSGSSTLPLEIYEHVVDIVGGKSVNRFVKIAGGDDGGYKIETGEAERIAVESASKQATTGASSGNTSGPVGKPGQESSESTLIAGLSTQRNAIQMLQSRIGVLLQYLDAVSKGTLQPDHETLRQISSLVSSISSSSRSSPQDADFAREFEREQHDVLLTSILGQMTRNLESTNILVDKFGVSQQKDGGPGGDDGFGNSMMLGGAGGRKPSARGKGRGMSGDFFGGKGFGH